MSSVSKFILIFCLLYCLYFFNLCEYVLLSHSIYFLFSFSLIHQFLSSSLCNVQFSLFLFNCLPLPFPPFFTRYNFLCWLLSTIFALLWSIYFSLSLSFCLLICHSSLPPFLWIYISFCSLVCQSFFLFASVRLWHGWIDLAVN